MIQGIWGIGNKRITDRIPVGFSNTGLVVNSCFKCDIPDGYSPVGTTHTFWGVSRGKTSVMTSGEDNNTFFKLGDWDTGLAIARYQNNSSSAVSLLEEWVAWKHWYPSNFTGFHHYAMTVSAANRVNVYVDGIQMLTLTNTFRPPILYFSLCGYAISPFDAGMGRYLIRVLNGTVARYAIYNRVLGTDEIAADMDLGPSEPDRQSLQHLWIYSSKDEVGGWDLEPVAPAYISDDTPWS